MLMSLIEDSAIHCAVNPPGSLAHVPFSLFPASISLSAGRPFRIARVLFETSTALHIPKGTQNILTKFNKKN